MIPAQTLYRGTCTRIPCRKARKQRLRPKQSGRSFAQKTRFRKTVFPLIAYCQLLASQNENFTASCNSRGLFPFASELTTAAVP